MAVAVAGARAGAKLWSKSEPEPKINNFGSATLRNSTYFMQIAKVVS